MDTFNWLADHSHIFVTFGIVAMFVYDRLTLVKRLEASVEKWEEKWEGSQRAIADLNTSLAALTSAFNMYRDFTRPSGKGYPNGQTF